jgi:hypothetical protein
LPTSDLSSGEELTFVYAVPGQVGDAVDGGEAAEVIDGAIRSYSRVPLNSGIFPTWFGESYTLE